MTVLRLTNSDPDWTYVDRNGHPVHRYLRCWESENVVFAVVTEADQPGMSITEAAAEVRAALNDRYPARRVVVIEHYLPGIGIDPAEHFDVVSWPAGRQPQWTRLPADAVRALFAISDSTGREPLVFTGWPEGTVSVATTDEEPITVLPATNPDSSPVWGATPPVPAAPTETLAAAMLEMCGWEPGRISRRLIEVLAWDILPGLPRDRPWTVPAQLVVAQVIMR